MCASSQFLTEANIRCTGIRIRTRKPNRVFPSETAPMRGRFPSIMDDEDQPPLPEEGNLPAVLAEMEALQAVSDAIKWGWAKDRALSLVGRALRAQPEPTSIEGWLVRAALTHCLGEPLGVPPLGPSEATRPADRLFEDLACGWIRWTSGGDRGLLETIEAVPPDTQQGDLEILSLFYWGQALKNLVNENVEESQRFFLRAIEVGSQFGTPSNPGICWTYYASFFRHP